MNWTSYFLQVNLYLVLFYTFYWLFLRRETFFKLNRIYLVGSAFFSALIPLMKTEFMQSFFITKEVQQNWANLNIIMTEGFASPLKEDNHWVLGDYLTLIYFVMVLGLFARLIYRLIQVSRLLKTDQSFEAFSFFKTIRINKDLPQQEMIEKHEMAHAKEFHSADVIFFEVLSIINWFNPIVYLYKRSVKHIHEFIADQHALEDQTDKSEYALLLFSKSFGVNPHSLTNTFFNQSILKKRIEMMNKKQSKRTAILKYGLSVPLFLLAMILSSAKISENKTIDTIADAVKPKQEISKILMPEAVKELVLEPTKKEKLGLVKVYEDSLKSDAFQGLRKHLGRTLKYPQESKSKGVTGNIVIEFSIDESGLIVSSRALNWSENELSKEGLKEINSYGDKINVAKGNYSVSIFFTLEGAHEVTYLNNDNVGVLNNYIGYIKVVAYLPKDDKNKEIVVTGYATPKNLMMNEVVVNGDKQKEEEEPIFSVVEDLPSFSGGMEAFGKFLSENLKYPSKAKENKIEGRVFLTFVVEMDGRLTDIKVVRGIGAGCDEEAVRVLAISPKWIPGKQNGKVVRVGYTIPIFFALKGKVNKVGTINSSEKKQEIFSLEKSDDGSLKLIDHTKGNVLTSSKIVFNSKEVPLIYLDGKKIDQEKLQTIDPNTIQSIDVLKKTELLEKYGKKGKNGVILITSKENN